MSVKDVPFLSFDRSGETGQDIELTIDPSLLTLTESISSTRAMFLSEQGEEISTSVNLHNETNSVIAEVPVDIHPGKYAFGVSLADSMHPGDRWIVSTPLDSITIRDSGGATSNTPIIENVRFLGGSTTISDKLLQTTPLIARGKYLSSITECHFSGVPSLMFNQITKNDNSVSFRAVNLPPVKRGVTINRVTFKYEIADENGIVIESGSLSAPYPVSIVDDE